MSRLANLYRAVTNTVRDPFTAETTGLPEAGDTQALELAHSETIAITAGPVRKQLGQHTVRMLAYNGFIPGPTLRVRQGSELTVRFTNNADVETTVHWHGLRLDNAFDGVPERHHGMQAPIPVGGEFTYRLRFPDPGIYWYHPHVRQDYTQELGLYGNILVESTDPTYWSPANREVVLVLDDILLKGSKVAPFSQTGSTRTAMGRYGDVMLINGQTDFAMAARHGEVVRFYLTNTANVRPFNIRIPGAQMKLVGGDGGRIEREQFVSEILIAPSERAVVDVLFAQSGDLAIEHTSNAERRRQDDLAHPLPRSDAPRPRRSAAGARHASAARSAFPNGCRRRAHRADGHRCTRPRRAERHVLRCAEARPHRRPRWSPSTIRAMSDQAVRGYVATTAASAELVTSVCTGSLILGAAGLLEGRPASTNWFFSGVLSQFGARYRRARWVHDGNIIMSAGCRLESTWPCT